MLLSGLATERQVQVRCDIVYRALTENASLPSSPLEQKITEHQWAVYDFSRTIPRGRVTTYGALCKALGQGSPRSGEYR